MLKGIKANCNSPISVYAKIVDEEIFLTCEIYDHLGKKIFSKKLSDKKKDHIKMANKLADEILINLGQDKINQLEELHDFNYTP